MLYDYHILYFIEGIVVNITFVYEIYLYIIKLKDH